MALSAMSTYNAVLRQRAINAIVKTIMRTALASTTVEDPPRTSLQDRKQEFARNAIWDAAIDLFFEKGFDETTVDEIAA